MQLEAFKYYYTPGKEIGVAGIDIRRTPAMLTLKEKLVAAVAPFTVGDWTYRRVHRGTPRPRK
jgi:hypothetical protein